MSGRLVRTILKQIGPMGQEVVVEIVAGLSSQGIITIVFAEVQVSATRYFLKLLLILIQTMK
jgi:hypothetical protein